MINGVVAVPVMVVLMLLGVRKDVMGSLLLPLPLRILGWLATVVMAAAAVVMIFPGLCSHYSPSHAIAAQPASFNKRGQAGAA